MKKQIAWIFGGLSVASLAMVASLNACSSGDDSTVKDSGAKDSTGTDTGTADCGSIPTLHPTDAGSIFCGYPADGGSSFSCTTGTQCCLGGPNGQNFYPEDCVTWGANCDNPGDDGGAIPIPCEQSADCTANGATGDVCCLQGAAAPTAVQGCGYYKATGGKQIACETPSDAGACTGSGEIQICSSDADCPSGHTCTPMKWKLYQLGFCL